METKINYEWLRKGTQATLNHYVSSWQPMRHVVSAQGSFALVLLVAFILEHLQFDVIASCDHMNDYVTDFQPVVITINLLHAYTLIFFLMFLFSFALVFCPYILSSAHSSNIRGLVQFFAIFWHSHSTHTLQTVYSKQLNAFGPQMFKGTIVYVKVFFSWIHWVLNQ